IPAWQAQRRAALADTLPGWHQTQAAEFEKAGQWFAAAFHLDRLIQAEPQSGNLYLRRGRALAGQGKEAEARQDIEKALQWKEGLTEAEQAEVKEKLGNAPEPPK